MWIVDKTAGAARAVLLLTLTASLAWAQPRQDLELAREYQRRGEHDKAVGYYQKLVKDDKAAEKVFPEYLVSLKALKDYKEIEKASRRMYKETRRPEYLLEAALAEKEGGDQKGYRCTLEDAVGAAKTPPAALQLYGQLIRRGEPDFAEQAILRARKLSGDPDAYGMELAQTYRARGQTDKMVDELLARAQRDPMAMAEVQGILQQSLEKKEEVTLFEKKLLDRVQADPQSTALNELLYWLYLQQKDFDGAFVQAKALEKRETARRGYPTRLIEVAGLARTNGDLDMASEIYRYIASEFGQSEAGFQALRQLVSIDDERLRASYPVDLAKAKTLVEDYRRLAATPGNFTGKNEVKRDMARILGFVLERYDTAIAVLGELTLSPRILPDLQARAKLDMGDLFLIKGEPWESTLIYSQVEKDQKDQPLGHEAKLRNAKLSFYKGEFTLAKEHLGVLKLATSREIANDAMQLGLMIQDNLVFDTTGEGLSYYGRAELLLMKQRHDQALRTLDSIQTLFAGHSLTDDVLWKKAQIFRQTRRYDEAKSALEKILASYRQDIYGDDALFTLAEMEEKDLKNKARAMELYEQVLKDFPGSIYGAEARKRFRTLRGDAL